MSLPPRMIPPVPEDTAKVARDAFPHGNVYMQMRDEFDGLYTDEMFADLYPQDGQPGLRPWRLAWVTVMQFAENLSDRQAADAVRDRIAWKYALSLELSDPGFDFSVLSEFRQRLLMNEAGQRLLDEMLRALRAKGYVKERGRQRADSTHVLAAVRELNRLENIGTTLRHALNSLAVVVPEWLRAQVPPEWFERYGPRFEQYRMPKSEAQRQKFGRRWLPVAHGHRHNVYHDLVARGAGSRHPASGLGPAVCGGSGASTAPKGDKYAALGRLPSLPF